MDLYAYNHKNRKRIESWFENIPRPRGVRLMFFQQQQENEENKEQLKLFNSFCGKDVIMIHTRCGECGLVGDKDNNYLSCKMDEFEKEFSCLEAIDDDFDNTYRDSYFEVPDKFKEDYEKLKEALIEISETIEVD